MRGYGGFRVSAKRLDQYDPCFLNARDCLCDVDSRQDPERPTAHGVVGKRIREDCTNR